MDYDSGDSSEIYSQTSLKSCDKKFLLVIDIKTIVPPYEMTENDYDSYENIHLFDTEEISPLLSVGGKFSKKAEESGGNLTAKVSFAE